ncbi:MAG: hypothetical protein P1U32_02775 [Legionellaceae bacterium]|nr:hypothetical protein [Legionellaceae bacterium]
MTQNKHAGFTWLSTLLVLAIVGGLLMQGASLWRASRIQTARRVLFHDMTRILAFARTEAFLRGETLAILPDSNQNWAVGLKLQASNPVSLQIHAWRWHMPQGMKLTWHGFLGRNKLLVSHKPEHLAMNGYFLLEGLSGVSEKWVVNRFGRMRVLRKHVA